MKLPAIQFYPGDWHKDQGVQSLDLLQRGAWFELLLMMHDSDERGVLLVNGQPMPDEVIARRLGLDNQTANQILTTLLTYGVASRREKDGALFCRRMVKDENLRQIRTAAGKKGGNPRLLNQNPNQNTTTGDKQIPTPSSSSSITSSLKETPPTPGVGVGAAPAQDSKKNEAPAAAENYPADDSPASASHTGPAAAGGDTRPEFRPDPVWAPEMRQLVDQMAAYWKLTIAQADAKGRLGRFCRTQFEGGQGELLSRQFQAYRAYKAERDERVHSWKGYIGDESQGYANGAWNEKDWVAALADARKTSLQHGNHRLSGAAGNGSATDSSQRHRIPARINYENDAA